ncbi:hypothetical protein F66182_7604 [Fusarium sp. NRRL 66182]|nr:hypothetical protein F66182_7604 [Fusarium sp. NRRL 66182]
MADQQTLSRDQVLSSLPPVAAQGLRSQTRQQLSSSNRAPILVILDDDPTGTQTCHHVNILTVWGVQRLVSEFKQTKSGGGFFILTNSRALHPQQARALIVEICTNLQAAAEETNSAFEVVLRSDSTLRGHFPLEAEAAEHRCCVVSTWPKNHDGFQNLWPREFKA